MDLLYINDRAPSALQSEWENRFGIILRQYLTQRGRLTRSRPKKLDWVMLIGDVRHATAILEQLMHHAENISSADTGYR